MRSSVLTRTSRQHDAGRTALVVLFAIASMLSIVLFALLANASFLAVKACAQPAVERFVLPGQRIEICDLAGAVRIVQGTGTRAEVIVTRGGPDAAQLRVEQNERGGESQLHVIFPGHRVVYSRTKPWSTMHGWGSTNLTVGADGCLGHGGGFPLSGHRVTVSGSGPGLHAWADVEVRLPRGCQTTLRLGVGEVSAEGVEGHLTLDVAAAPVTAERTSGSLIVDTGSGSVVLRGNRGDISVDTGSGGVELSDLSGSRLKVDTGSGGVTGRNVEAGDLLVDTGSGSVNIDGMRSGSISIDTGSGGVHLGLLSAPRSLLVDTGSGGVTILGPADLGAQVELETGSGSIQSDYAMMVDTKDHGYLRGTIGSGGGRIRVDTGSGGVSLRRR
jgi:lia operon protein LiaG